MGIYNNKLMLQISQIIKRCNEDLKKDTIQTRDSYYQIKAFHYDSIEKLVRRVAEEEQEMMPAEDVKPVVHAHWIRHDGNEKYDECSNCHCAYNSCGWEAYGYYCPHCGAKMDEGATNEAD